MDLVLVQAEGSGRVLTRFTHEAPAATFLCFQEIFLQILASITPKGTFYGARGRLMRQGGSLLQPSSTLDRS